MNQSGFIEWLVEAVLGWSRWLSDLLWGSIQGAGQQGGFMNWFSRSWPAIAVMLIIIGVIVDWLVWMVRWRPYWLWFHKRQIIYEDAPSGRTARERRQQQRLAADGDYYDPFARGGSGSDDLWEGFEEEEESLPLSSDDDVWVASEPEQAEDDLFFESRDYDEEYEDDRPARRGGYEPEDDYDGEPAPVSGVTADDEDFWDDPVPPEEWDDYYAAEQPAPESAPVRKPQPRPAAKKRLERQPKKPPQRASESNDQDGWF